ARPARWGGLRGKLGHMLKECRGGDRARNLEEAIACYQDALAVFDPAQSPVPWAMSHFGLGQVYSERGQGGVDTERAINHFDQAESACDRQALPWLWLDTQECLGQAYARREYGDPAENKERSLVHFQAMAQAVSRETDALGWVLAQGALAEAYRQRLRG